MDILDVGCGKAKTPGAVGIDFNQRTAADIIHDLDAYPWPIESNTFDLIVGRHIVEHIDDLNRFMEELHRIGRPGAVVEITTPHFSSRFSYTDPTHRHYLSIFSFDYFLEPSPFRPSFISRALETQSPVADFYSQARFRTLLKHLGFARPFRLTGIQWLANRFPGFYEGYLAFIFPARDIEFKLEVTK